MSSSLKDKANVSTALLSIPNELISKVEDFVRTHMSAFDGSHDFAHIQRVVRLALHIGRLEHSRTPRPLNLNLIHISALLHDVNDRKYFTENSTSVFQCLQNLDCDPSAAAAVADIVANVSFTKERLNPAPVAEVLMRWPELGVVQDADRIDAVGAVGIGRLFTYGGARDRTLEQSMSHLVERLLQTADLMKTRTGEVIISERIRRTEIFREWWDEENDEKGLIGLPNQRHSNNSASSGSSNNV